VSDKSYSSDLFLRQGCDNYSKFIQLMSKKEHKYIVPTYQIDLMWHTHILSSIHQYHEHNMKVNDTIMNHDDSLNDRTEGGALDTNFRAMKELWFKVYNTEYSIPGGMYRGEPPKHFFEPYWVKEGRNMKCLHEPPKTLRK